MHYKLNGELRNSITLDKVSNNDSFVGMLKCQLNMTTLLLYSGEHFHICCCVHVLNLFVHYGLKEINKVVNKVH